MQRRRATTEMEVLKIVLMTLIRLQMLLASEVFVGLLFLFVMLSVIY